MQRDPTSPVARDLAYRCLEQAQWNKLAADHGKYPDGKDTERLLHDSAYRLIEAASFIERTGEPPTVTPEMVERACAAEWEDWPRFPEHWREKNRPLVRRILTAALSPKDGGEHG